MDISSSLEGLLAKVQNERQQLPFILHQTQQAHFQLISEAYAEAAYDIEVNYQHLEHQLQEILNQINTGQELGDLGRAMIETIGHIQPQTCELMSVKTELYRRVPRLVRRINTEGPELLASVLAKMRCRLPLCDVCSQLLGSLGLQRTAPMFPPPLPANSSIFWTCSNCSYEFNQMKTAACSRCRVDGLLDTVSVAAPKKDADQDGRTCEACTLYYSKTMQSCPLCLTRNPEAPVDEDVDEDED